MVEPAFTRRAVAAPLRTISAPPVTRAAPASSHVAMRTPVAVPQHQRVDPFENSARLYTLEGGVKLIFRAAESPFWRKLTAFCLWVGALAGLVACMFLLSPVPPVPRGCFARACDIAFWPLVWNVAAGIAAVIAFSFIITARVEFYRSLEVRHDCFIINGREIFWRTLMKWPWPSFVGTVEGLTLCGTYGDRFIEFVTIARADEFDRAPERVMTYYGIAIDQLWDAVVA